MRSWRSWLTGPTSRANWEGFTVPIPCSPVSVPPSDRASSKIPVLASAVAGGLREALDVQQPGQVLA